MFGRTIAFGALCAVLPTGAAAQATVHVAPPQLDGPRALAPQTAQAVVRDYLESWKAMRSALEQNQPALLNADFVGTAKDKLTSTVHDQAAAGIHTRYQDRAHNLQIIFYSPEGLSIEMADTVDYDVQVYAGDKLLTTQPVHARYLVMMTPSQVRWRVRVLQAANP